jgi:glycosyltransferase involved in cell wall biosynthesis
MESILAQTLVDFEFIVVDNGSTDSSGAIADRYAQGDSRVRVIHRVRGNIGSGRNAGLDAARGEYVAFIDDDDRADPDFLEFLYQLAATHNADVAACGSTKEENGRILPNFLYGDLRVMDAEQATEAYLRRKLYNAAMPTKLVRRKLFEKVRFCDTGSYDDIGTAYRCFVHANRVAAQGLPKYCFYRHPGNNSSAATKFEQLNPLQLNEYLAAFRERTEYIGKFLPRLRAFAQYSEWSYMISMVEKIHRFGLKNCAGPLAFMEHALLENWQRFYDGPYTMDFEKNWMKCFILGAQT